MKNIALSLLTLLSCLFFSGCEKLDIPSAEPEKGNITLHISTVSQVPFSVKKSTKSAMGDVCERINIAIFNAEGEKVKSVNQTSETEDFGTVNFSLAQGDYIVVAVAHSCAGNATIKSADEVSFPNNKLTDTFSAAMSLSVGEESKEVSVMLERRVAMVRLIMTDKQLPDDFAEIEFYYTGGSSTLNALTGFGAKASRQTETRARQDAKIDDEGNTVFEVYTIPHEPDDLLDMKITAKNTGGSDMIIHQWTNLPITLNTITQCRGDFFKTSQPQSSTAMSVSINAVWGDTNTIDF